MSSLVLSAAESRVSVDSVPPGKLVSCFPLLQLG